MPWDLASALEDFGNPAAAGIVLALPEPMPVGPSPAEERAEAIARAVAKAERELSDRLAAEYDAIREADRKAMADEVAALREELGQRAAERVRDAFGEMEQRLVATTAQVAARVLGAIASEDLQRRSIERLTAIIREALADDETVRIRVAGPAALADMLTAALGPKAGLLRYDDAPGFDLTVAINDSLYETRLAEWSAALTGIVAEDAA